MASYLDATADTEALAAERESALLALTENVELAVPRLRAATDAVAQTERTLAQLTAEHDLLTSIRLPDGINELDTAITAQQQALQRAKDAERSAQAADAAARDALAAAPDRGPLEQARREHAEQRRILTEVPSARTDVEAAATRLEQAGQQSTAAGQAVDTSRDARDAAASDAAAASSLVARLTIEAESLSAVTLPAGLTELDDRIHDRRRTLTESAERLAAAERADAAARAALRGAPRPRTVGADPAAGGRIGCCDGGGGADPAARATGVAKISCEPRATSLRRPPPATRPVPPGTRPSSRAVRRHCDRTWWPATPARSANRSSRPSPRRRTRRNSPQPTRPLPQRMPRYRRPAPKISRLRSWWRQSTPSWTTATERVAALQSALDGQPTDEAVIREALSGLDRLDAQARAADESVQPGTKPAHCCPGDSAAGGD